MEGDAGSLPGPPSQDFQLASAALGHGNPPDFGDGRGAPFLAPSGERRKTCWEGSELRGGGLAGSSRRGGAGTPQRHGAAWSPSDAPTPLSCVTLVGSRHPINPGSRDLNSRWPSPVTGSKTNSSSCKLSITGKAGGGGGGHGQARRTVARARARSCYPRRGMRGTPTPGSGAAGPPPFVSPLQVPSLNPLCSAIAQFRKPSRWGGVSGS